MKRFSEAIQSKILLFDGSMGALLSRMGHVTPGPDELAVTRPDVIRSVHQGYLDAGADVLLSDTFGATEMTLAHKKRAGMGETITATAVRLAREVAGSRALVAVDMGPTSAFLYPTGEAMPADFYKTFFDQARCAKENGADFAMIETQTDLGEARLACLAARAAGLEAAVSFTFGRKTGRTLTGSPAECCVAALEAAGAAALGLNCSPSPEDMLGLLRAMRRVSALPVVVQPNAGMPETAPDGSTFYPYSPEKMRECARAAGSRRVRHRRLLRHDLRPYPRAEAPHRRSRARARVGRTGASVLPPRLCDGHGSAGSRRRPLRPRGCLRPRGRRDCRAP